MCTPSPLPSPSPAPRRATPFASLVQIDALGAEVACDHALVVVACLVGQRLDGDKVAWIDLELRLQESAEITPVHRIDIGRQMMMPRR
jgi:hypothetical protein